MVEVNSNFYLYKVPSIAILENRKQFYALKRETDERTETWLKRIQWHIKRCAFPKIIEFLLIDKFMCELNFNEMDFMRHMEAWTLNQLLEYFADDKIVDGQWMNDANIMVNQNIVASRRKPTELFEMDPLSLNPTIDIDWPEPNQSETDEINEMLIIDSMECEVEINDFPTSADKIKAKRIRKNKLKHQSNTNVGAYRCDQCKKTFTRLDNLNVHKNNFHPRTTSNACIEETSSIGERRFRCDQCEKSFTQSSDLRRHKQEIHQEIRPFPCDQCDKSFTRSSHLKDHKKSIHEGIKPDKPFNCDQCEYSFTRMSHLKKHKHAVHDKIRPYSCTLCEKSFTELGNFKRHMHRTHP